MTVDVRCGDCLDVLRAVPDGSVNLIVTSPPYGQQRAKTYGGIDPDQYVRWFLPRAAEFQRALAPDGSFVLNIKECVVNGQRHLYVHKLVIALVEAQGWLLTDEYIWHKKNCVPGKWPNRFRDAWEHLYHFTKERRFKMNQDAVMVPMGDWATTRIPRLSEADKTRRDSAVGSGASRRVANWEGRDKAYPTNVQMFGAVTSEEAIAELDAEDAGVTAYLEQLRTLRRALSEGREIPSGTALHMATECANRGHSAAFPVGLPDWFIRLFTDPGDLVLDPFSGSGTTGVACCRNGRRFLGMEIDEGQCQRSREVLAGTTPENPDPLTADTNVCDLLGMRGLRPRLVGVEVGAGGR